MLNVYVLAKLTCPCSRMELIGNMGEFPLGLAIYAEGCIYGNLLIKKFKTGVFFGASFISSLFKNQNKTIQGIIIWYAIGPNFPSCCRFRLKPILFCARC